MRSGFSSTTQETRSPTRGCSCETLWTTALADLDPEGKDPGLEQMVVMGHSQGGLLDEDDSHRYRHESLAF